MFGDGAGAIVLGAGSGEGGVLDCMARSIGGGMDPGMILRVGGALAPAGSQPENGHREKVYDHDFKRVIRHAPQLMKTACEWLSEERGYDLSKVDLFIPPQANGRLIGLVGIQFGVPSKKIFSNFQQVGNTVSASIYIALDQLNRQGALKHGDLLVLVPAEATKWLCGAVVIRWTRKSR